MAKEARVNESWPWQQVRALGGLEFVKYQWRRVPEGQEDEAASQEEAGLLVLRDAPAPGDELDDLDYRDLQSVAKAHGIAANQSAEDLKAQIRNTVITTDEEE